MTNLLELAEHCEKAEIDNKLDVLIEIALFEPSEHYSCAVVSDDGERIVLKKIHGGYEDGWIPEYTSKQEGRNLSGAFLRAHHALMNNTVD